MKKFDLSVYREKRPGLVTRDGREITKIKICEGLKYITYHIADDDSFHVAGLKGKAYGNKKELDIFMI